MSTKGTYTFEGKILKSTSSALRKAQTSWRIAMESHRQKLHDLKTATDTLYEQVTLGEAPVQGIMLRTDKELTVFVDAYKQAVTSEVLGGGDGTETTFARTLGHTGIVPGSLELDFGGVAGVDDGLGAITGAGITSGTVNYLTGAVSVILASPLADHVLADVGYEYYLSGITVKPNLEDQEGLFVVLGSITAFYYSNESGNDANIEIFVVGVQVTV